VLAIDAAGSACAAAVAAGEELLAITSVAMLHGQAEALLPMVEDVVRKAGLTPSALDLISVTTGPGSFTGIRVGIAAARGIALARGLPLIGVSSFAAVTAAVRSAVLAERPLLVALETRRADLYVQLFDADGRPLWEPSAKLPETLALAFVGDQARAVTIAGDAAARAAKALAQTVEVSVVEGASPPPVAGVLTVALQRWRHGERSRAVQPLYLRPPGVSISGIRPSPAPR
jgi:tRNA threonylcarbamoyladenosine biosynthesis protein TsaB